MLVHELGFLKQGIRCLGYELNSLKLDIFFRSDIFPSYCFYLQLKKFTPIISLYRSISRKFEMFTESCLFDIRNYIVMVESKTFCKSPCLHKQKGTSYCKTAISGVPKLLYFSNTSFDRIQNSLNEKLVLHLYVESYLIFVQHALGRGKYILEAEISKFS
ncbi:hypothetical protein PV328_000989 [Microctonus aethiopoides]|uniref:Uncharacterized protein n=1 Tax=Microctonus aethiopoides TaxID=144406 RepID=A0AA39KX61_9HYME|nr:hypothetical protein PV328_000989 [Microctonus aethiopoides]